MRNWHIFPPQWITDGQRTGEEKEYFNKILLLFFLFLILLMLSKKSPVFLRCQGWQMCSEVPFHFRMPWWWSTFSYPAHRALTWLSKEELPPYYQPWMDIALRVPELVHSHELRLHINKVSGDNKLTRTIRCVCGAVVQCCHSVCPDAAAGHPASAETPGVTAGPPGPQRDDHGLHLAGGREQHSRGISVCFWLFPDISHSDLFFVWLWNFNNPPLRCCHITWLSRTGRCHSVWDFHPS